MKKYHIQTLGKQTFHFLSSIHVARNNPQDTFQCMEKQGNIMKITGLFNFDDLPLKVVYSRLQN